MDVRAGTQAGSKTGTAGCWLLLALYLTLSQLSYISSDHLLRDGGASPPWWTEFFFINLRQDSAPQMQRRPVSSGQFLGWNAIR